MYNIPELRRSPHSAVGIGKESNPGLASSSTLLLYKNTQLPPFFTKSFNYFFYFVALSEENTLVLSIWCEVAGANHIPRQKISKISIKL
ncbi:unnamed protein product [Cuscuta campestris]|uniref:Uncharacterized protein n=1 Tax=Cuscuta campestris TaxID=132261 RepID=A0A484MJG5_9ASTE|nr:unnamed protein product [Cuscuta campestris]